MTKIARLSQMIVLMFAISAISGNAQKADVYIHDMGQALLPFGSIQAPNCHSVEITPGRFESFVLATGKDEQGKVLWSLYRVDAIRFSFDMSDLNEDKVKNDMVRSASSVSKHKDGTPYPAEDLAVVIISTSDQAKKITVHAVDFDKLNTLQPNGERQYTDAEMGAKTELRTAILMSFLDKERAETFVGALKKAIIACKAQ